MDPANSSTSSTNPTPQLTPSIAELRTWLLELSQQLTTFERTLARAEFPTRRTLCLIGSPSSPEERAERLKALRWRLVLISELLAAMDRGAALVPPEQQLAELLLSNSITRLRALEEPPASPSTDGADPPSLPLPNGGG